MTSLSSHSLGRVLLHLTVLVRSRRHVRWHLAGIRRELLHGSTTCRRFIVPRARAFVRLPGWLRPNRRCDGSPAPRRPRATKNPAVPPVSPPDN